LKQTELTTPMICDSLALPIVWIECPYTYSGVPLITLLYKFYEKCMTVEQISLRYWFDNKDLNSCPFTDSKLSFFHTPFPARLYSGGAILGVFKESFSEEGVKVTEHLLGNELVLCGVKWTVRYLPTDL